MTRLEILSLGKLPVFILPGGQAPKSDFSLAIRKVYKELNKKMLIGKNRLNVGLSVH